MGTAIDRLKRALSQSLVPGKTCNRCGSYKLRDQFHSGKGYSDGLKPICKACHSEIYNPRKRAEYAVGQAVRHATKPSRTCSRCRIKKPRVCFAGEHRYCLECDAVVRQWRIERRDRIMSDGNSRARRTVLLRERADGSLTIEVLKQLFADAKDCPYCGVTMKSREKTLDHINPISRGGVHSLSNVVVCCRRCNSLKRDLGLVPFLAMLSFMVKSKLAGKPTVNSFVTR